MNRRLRKKKRVGEYRELGFEVRADLRDGHSKADIEAFVDRFIVAIEARGLAFGGGGGHHTFGAFVTRPRRGSATDDDRDAIARFLRADAVVARSEVGALVDAWRGCD